MHSVILRHKHLLILRKGIEINLETITRYYRIDRREIAFLKFILEAYDGLAVVTTIDSLEGIISITIAPGCIQDAEEIIQGLENEIMIEKIEKISFNLPGMR